MSLVRSHVFIPVGLASQQATVPGGKIWLVKYVTLYNDSNAVRTYNIAVKVDGGTQRTIQQGNLAAFGFVNLAQPFTIDAGDVLVLASNVATTVVHASGIQFTP